MTRPIPQAARSQLIFGRGRPGPRRPKRARLPEAPVTLSSLMELVDRWYPTTAEARRLSCHILYRAHQWPEKPAEHCSPEADTQGDMEGAPDEHVPAE